MSTTTRPDASLLDERVQLMLDLADEASAIVLEHFQSPTLRVESKSDASPVTLADRRAEEVLRAAIRRRFRGDAILGEEHGDEPGTGGWRWIIDPIDGTISFAAGVPLFGVLIAVEHEGVVVAGCAAMPALAERVFAVRGGGAWWERGTAGGGRDRRPARVRTGRALPDALVCVSGLEYFRRVEALDVLARVVASARHVRSWSDCYGGVLVATGRVDGWVDPIMHPWDLAPFPLMIAEAGGTCTDWRGTADIAGGNAVAGDPRLHGELLRLAQRPQ